MLMKFKVDTRYLGSVDYTTTLPTQVCLALRTEYTSCPLVTVRAQAEARSRCGLRCLLLQCEHSGDGGVESVDVWFVAGFCLCNLCAHRTLH